MNILINISEKLHKSLIKHEQFGKTITLKIKYFDFEQVTRSISLEEPIQDMEDIKKWALSLLEKTEAGDRPIRLAGISLSNLSGENLKTFDQLALF